MNGIRGRGRGRGRIRSRMALVKVMLCLLRKRIWMIFDAVSCKVLLSRFEIDEDE